MPNKHWVTETREGGTIKEPMEPTGLLHGWTMGKGKDGSKMLVIWRYRTEVALTKTSHRGGALQGMGSHGGARRCYTESVSKVTSAFALRQRQLSTSLVTSLLLCQEGLRLERHRPGQTHYLSGPDWPYRTLHAALCLQGQLRGLASRLHNWLDPWPHSQCAPGRARGQAS